MRQNQPSYYPFDAKSVEFLPAEDATMPPIPLVRAAFGVPVLKVLRAIGVAEAEFRRVGISIYAETPITLMPEKPWWELLVRLHEVQSRIPEADGPNSPGVS